jgi:hypothetical protein
LIKFILFTCFLVAQFTHAQSHIPIPNYCRIVVTTGFRYFTGKAKIWKKNSKTRKSMQRKERINILKGIYCNLNCWGFCWIFWCVFRFRLKLVIHTVKKLIEGLKLFQLLVLCD